MAKLDTLSTEAAFEELVSSGTGLKVIHFACEWSQPCGEMTKVLCELKADDKTYPGVVYAQIDPEALPQISMKHNIVSVPTVILFADGKEIGRVGGLRKEALADLIKSYIANPKRDLTLPSPVTVGKPKAEKQPLEDRLKNLINKSEVMMFMKGNPVQPRCGFSKTLIGILNETGVPYETFDILEDEEVRQGLKTYSNWQTYPQVYVKGELIGGLDIVKELQETGELLSTLKGES